MTQLWVIFTPLIPQLIRAVPEGLSENMTRFVHIGIQAVDIKVPHWWSGWKDHELYLLESTKTRVTSQIGVINMYLTCREKVHVESESLTLDNAAEGWHDPDNLLKRVAWCLCILKFSSYYDLILRLQARIYMSNSAFLSTWPSGMFIQTLSTSAYR